jgi:hypothetical protein
MQFWYLGALVAADKMARHLGDTAFADQCRALFEQGRAWTDANLFNGEYYEHRIQLPKSVSDIAPSLLVGMGASDSTKPDFQLGAGCLVDQLVGQYLAHVCGLGYLANPEHIRRTLQSILKYNHRDGLTDHFNNMRSFALGHEKALLMASFPRERPRFPFPYFPEAMTGFEYTAAIGMIYEGQVEAGLACIRNIRERYDGRRRSPFNEAECGHHYARAMASWAAVLALTGFQYSAVDQRMTFAARPGRCFWSTGYGYGTCLLSKQGDTFDVTLDLLGGKVTLHEFNLTGHGVHRWDQVQHWETGAKANFRIPKS